ncbi:Polyamine aminopropyltransferase [Candidatus Calditenuaceae archaeon HR02]|nr:Polyamine aminopropyltransferase [Candidatus Calditenuaceae archaeon HR02]
MSKTCFDTAEYIVYQPYPGLHVVYHAKKVLFSGQSRFQRIDIIDNEAYGVMLLLDGNIQHTEFDSHIFNKALVGPILRRRMRNVLVLGGGSGQTLKALLKSQSIERVTIVEIDPLVVEACRAHIPGVNEAFEDPRVNLVIDDAFKFIRRDDGSYDVLVLDLTEEWLGQSVGLEELYRFVAVKCRGRCSCYIGPASPQSGGPARRHQHIAAAKKFLKGLRIRKVFIPSFGSEQLFLYGGGL